MTDYAPQSAGRLAGIAAALRTRLARAPAAARTAGKAPPTIDGATGRIEPTPNPAEQGPDWLRLVPAEVRGLVAAHLPAGLPDHGMPAGLSAGLPELFAGLVRPQAEAAVPVPEGAQFLSRSFVLGEASRPYKLYVPSTYDGRKLPLVVMLHGCTQSPDDFAAGTGMNAAAEAGGMLVVYPGQTASANAQKCWNWFSTDDQRRGRGEPALIAGITRAVMAEFAVDERRVFVAGLSAGGAAAAIMGETYPELYAAVGVHSGLACGAASDLPTALAAMRGGSAAVRRSGPGGRVTPTIVFHGDRDTTVSPRNADAVVAQAGPSERTRTSEGRSAGGQSYTRTLHLDAAGREVAEHWTLHGAGHAWSGGSPAGSYTDPRGPDATAEMLRFFGEHPHPAPAATAG